MSIPPPPQPPAEPPVIATEVTDLERDELLALQRAISSQQDDRSPEYYSVKAKIDKMISNYQ